MSRKLSKKNIEKLNRKKRDLENKQYNLEFDRLEIAHDNMMDDYYQASLNTSDDKKYKNKINEIDKQLDKLEAKNYDKNSYKLSKKPKLKMKQNKSDSISRKLSKKNQEKLKSESKRLEIIQQNMMNAQHHWFDHTPEYKEYEKNINEIDKHLDKLEAKIYDENTYKLSRNPKLKIKQKKGDKMPKRKKRKGRKFSKLEKEAYFMKNVLNNDMKYHRLKDNRKIDLISDPTMGDANARKFIKKHKKQFDVVVRLDL